MSFQTFMTFSSFVENKIKFEECFNHTMKVSGLVFQCMHKHFYKYRLWKKYPLSNKMFCSKTYIILTLVGTLFNHCLKL